MGLAALCGGALMTGCHQAVPDPTLLGTLEADRIEIVAESAERILAEPVPEGTMLAADTVILSQDPARLNWRLAAETAELQRIQAQLAELLAGTRLEDLQQAEAQLASVRARLALARDERERAEQMRSRGLLSEQDLDRARRNVETLTSDQAAASAVLKRLRAGTRTEQVDAMRAAEVAQRARLQATELEISRLQRTAPRAGLLETLVLKTGDQPKPGDVLAVMLAADSVYARVFVPAPLRADLQLGQVLDVSVQGLDQPLAGRVRRLASEASFTPYYALHGDDAERLSYLAEIALPTAKLGAVPLGAPVAVVLPAAGSEP
ncbi:hemolysin secretion protein D [Ahniella affigens]|uniref:Hemolysin secretion protein D n=2 Tax=Ahniella affigens TaxID=2021234 RepID=A0A2P1PY18_9GAMM|nr:hemolysin secretion protein D [Ahniella affigens]